MAHKFYSPPSRCHGLPFGYAPEAEHVKLLFPAENVGYDSAEVVIKRNSARKLDLMIDDSIVVLLTPYNDSELLANADDEDEPGSSYLSCIPLFPSLSSLSSLYSSSSSPPFPQAHARSKATIVRIEMTDKAFRSLWPNPYYQHPSVAVETIEPPELKPQQQEEREVRQEKKDDALSHPIHTVQEESSTIDRRRPDWVSVNIHFEGTSEFCKLPVKKDELRRLALTAGDSISLLVMKG